MSPRPRLRATSTSRPSSIENIAIPSTSAGCTAASSSAAETAWHASDSSESASPLANAVCPMPAIAVRSTSGPATITSVPRRGSARLPALELGRAPLDEAGPAVLRVRGAGDELLRVRLVPERSGPVGLEGAVRELLGERDRACRHPGETAGPLTERLVELGPGHDLVGETEALGVARRHVVAEEEKLLRLLRTDQTGEEVGTAGVGHDRSADEHLDEAGLLGHDHEVAGEREVHAAAGGGAVHARDHRLLAVEDRCDQALKASLDHATGVADDRVGRARGFRQGGARLTQVGAGAEALLTASGEDHRAHGWVEGRAVQPLDDLVAHGDGHRVPGLGPVQRDPQHAVLQPALDVLDRLGLLGHVRTTRASRATAPRGRTTNGLMSSSRTSPARSIASRCTFMMTSTSASTSAGFWPRAPSSSGYAWSSRTMRPASSASNGGTRNVTSRSTSTNTPPSPTITTGPNNGSCEMPTTVSTPPLTVSQTSTPSTRARFPPARRALRISSSYT